MPHSAEEEAEKQAKKNFNEMNKARKAAERAANKAKADSKPLTEFEDQRIDAIKAKYAFANDEFFRNLKSMDDKDASVLLKLRKRVRVFVDEAGQMPQNNVDKWAEALIKWVVRMGKNLKFEDWAPIMFLFDADNLSTREEVFFTLLAAAATCPKPQVIFAKDDADEWPVDKSFSIPHILKLVKQHAPNVKVTIVTTPSEHEAADAMIKLLFDDGPVLGYNSMKKQEKGAMDDKGSLWNCANSKWTQTVLLSNDIHLDRHAINLNDRVKIVTHSLLKSGADTDRDNEWRARIPGDTNTAKPEDWAPFVKLQEEPGHWTTVFDKLMAKIKGVKPRRKIESVLDALPGDVWETIGQPTHARSAFARTLKERVRVN